MKSVFFSFFDFVLAFSLRFFQYCVIGSALHECTRSKLSKCISVESHTEAHTLPHSTGESFQSTSASFAVPTVCDFYSIRTIPAERSSVCAKLLSFVLALSNALEKQISWCASQNTLLIYCIVNIPFICFFFLRGLRHRFFYFRYLTLPASCQSLSLQGTNQRQIASRIALLYICAKVSQCGKAERKKT